MRLQLVFARVAFGGFVLAFILELTAAFGIRLGWWAFAPGQWLMMGSTALGLIALVCGVAWLASALARNTSSGWQLGVLGVIGAAALVYVPLDNAREVFTAPPIHDISTDIETAPAFEALLPLRAAAHATNSPDYDGARIVRFEGKQMTAAIAQKKAYPDIKVLGTLVVLRDLPPGATPQSKWFWRAKNTAVAMGWDVIAFDLKSGRIEATDSSFWSGTTDDIVIRVTPVGRGGVRIDIRSASRHGTSDFGRNAARVRAYLKELGS